MEEKLTAAWLRLSARIAKKLGRTTSDFSPAFTAAYFKMRNQYQWSDEMINGVMNAILSQIDKKAPDTWDNYLSQAVSAQQTQEPI